MPDLGDYAFEILMSYGISIALLIAIIGVSWVQARRAKAALQEIERDG
ncbi:MAG: heme exporter protein CcmD [Pseudomonadota bacterium]